MTGSWLYLRAWLRARSAVVLRLVLLTGVAGGVVLAILAAAHRTATVVDRQVAADNLSDVSVSWGPASGLGKLDPGAVKRLPQVAEAHEVDILFFRGRTNRGRIVTNDDMGLGGSPDTREFRAVDRSALVSGRRPDPRRADEIAPEQSAAAVAGLRLGDTLKVTLPTRREMGTDQPRFSGPTLRLRVVGIRRTIPAPTEGAYPIVELSPAFVRAHRAEIGAIPNLNVKLRHGAADVASFESAVERLADGDVDFSVTKEAADRQRRSVRIDSIALWLLGAVAALVAVLVIAQALVREGRAEAPAQRTLAALGATRRQLVTLAALRTVIVVVAALPVLVAVAAALSPLGPIGALARALEPDPGVHVDALVVGAGIATLAVVLVAASMLAAWLQAMRAARPSGPTAGAAPPPIRSVTSLLSPAAGTGVRMALHAGRGQAAVPARSTLATGAVAVAGVVLAFGFTDSLHRLTTTPRLFGRTWDVQAGDGFGPDLGRPARELLAHDRRVAAWSLAAFGQAEIAGRRVGVLGIEHARGSVGPPAIDGRPPVAADEVMLATRTLHDIGRDVGDVVPIRVGGRSLRARIVGRGVVPDETAALRLGHGAVLTMAGLRRLAPSAPRNVVLVTFVPGVDVAAASRSLGRKTGDPAAFSSTGRPVDLVSVGSVDSTPAVVAGLMVIVGLAALAHALSAAVRRRGLDFAVLQSLGFTRRDVRSAVAWQAMTIAAVSALVGIPLGIASGRWIWNVFADQLGVVPDGVVSVTAVLLVAPGALLAAVLVSALPARVAARRAAAPVLRAE